MIIPVVKLVAGVTVGSGLKKMTDLALKKVVLPNVVGKMDKVIITVGTSIITVVTTSVLKKEMEKLIDEFIEETYKDMIYKRPSLTFKEYFERREEKKFKEEKVKIVEEIKQKEG